jgi:glyoxylase-like metal-dependent hydrolase (beta-lactamase superfamily II)
VASAAEVDFRTGAPVAVTLDARWAHGVPRRSAATERPVQVHECDPHTFILRQSKTVSYEAPFLYLLCGNDRALLLDTGAVADASRCPLRVTVDRLLDGWLAAHPRAEYPLIVAHTHGHGDHVAGDGQFTDRPATTVVSRELTAVQEFFGFTDWPAQVVRLDLGGRVLEITGSPGHHRAAITVYDPWTGFLLTGDTVYPGRLYAPDFPAFRASLDRLERFTATRPVTAVLGGHVEMRTQPGRDYPVGATYQPDEAPLPMTAAQLGAVRAAATGAAATPGAHYFDDFAIYNGPCRLAMLGQLARGLGSRLRPW